MDRKRWFALGLLFLLNTWVNAQSEHKKLNILFCFADDGGRVSSAYREKGRPGYNDIVQTPAMERIAKEGIAFTNAYVNSPSCTPCRSSLLSGRYFFKTEQGAILNNAVWNPQIPSFPLILRDSGYHIGKSFKVWSPGVPADGPFDGQKHAYEKAGRDINKFSAAALKKVQAGQTFDAARKELLQQVRGNFEAFLGDNPQNKPWLYFFGPTNTHRIWEKGTGKKLWGIDPDSLKGKLPAFLPDVPEIREDFADYLGEVQAYDAFIGVLLQILEERKELERTVILVSCDHGPPGFPMGKCYLRDFGTQVTLLARYPGASGNRRNADFVQLMDIMPTLLDVGQCPIPPGVNGRSFHNLLTGQLATDPARNFVITGRERHVASAREGNLPYPHRALRTKEFLYIRNYEPDRWPMGLPAAKGEPASKGDLETNTYAAYPDMDASPTKKWLLEKCQDTRLLEEIFGKRPAEELYLVDSFNQASDKNVAADPAYQQILIQARGELKTKLENLGDPRLSDAPPFEKPPYTDVTPKAKNPKKK